MNKRLATLTLALVSSATLASEKITIETKEVDFFSWEKSSRVVGINGTSTAGVKPGSRGPSYGVNGGSSTAGSGSGGNGRTTSGRATGGRGTDPNPDDQDTGRSTGGYTNGGDDSGGHNGGFSGGYYGGANGGSDDGGNSGGMGYGNSRVGQIIVDARDAVGLGEIIYDLVQKGKPTNTTAYAPISIVPINPETMEPVSPFDLENCTFPVEKKYKAQIKNAVSVVVDFEYMLIFTHNCSYDGSGKYIQAAMIQPLSIRTSYGWDFNAQMTLNGIMNHGTKANPNVGAMLTIKYSMNSWRSAFERNDTVHITGDGQVKIYAR